MPTFAALAWAAPPVVVDLLRIAPDHPRVFVQATLPSGRPGLFLVDTGADTSALSGQTADELGLTVTVGCGELSGLSGRARMDCATLPEIRFGQLAVDDVAVAVDVPGLATTAGLMPLDGLLGNNVWSRFVLEFDVAAARLVLHPPGTVRTPRHADVLHYDGHHVFTPIEVRSQSGSAWDPSFATQVDTGASGLKVCGSLGASLSGVYTEGLESLRGIGASETLPPFRFLETTRRIRIDRARLGGRRFRMDDEVQWLDFHSADSAECTSGIRALLGFEYLEGHRVFFDYPGGHFWLERTRGRQTWIDGHARVLAQDVERHGDAPGRALLRASLMVGAGREDEALALLQDAVRGEGLPAEERGPARVLVAELLRALGRHTDAVEWLRPLDPAALVSEGQLVGSVNGLVFDQRIDEALALARAGALARPDDGWAHVALSDALLAAGRADEAADALSVAVRLEQYDDAHLLRRARVALAEGDRHGALTHLRRLLELYPFGGMFLWFYALLVDTDEGRATFRADMDAALARLHPTDRPLDFEVAALHEIGDQEAALHRMREGSERFCSPLADGPERDNCLAWFAALAGVDLDAAAHRIARALEVTGPRPDFLDTAAMVHLARGDWDDALAHARHAARLGPDDVYMVWQAERIADLILERSGGLDVARPGP